jgi:hypothetical protein
MGSKTVVGLTVHRVFESLPLRYVGPGHTPILYAGTEVVEVSPSEELGRTMELVTQNMEEMEASA